MKKTPLVLGTLLVANLAFMAGGALADRRAFQQYADAYTLVDENGTARQAPTVLSWRAPRTSAGRIARCVAIVGTGISCYQQAPSR